MMQAIDRYINQVETLPPAPRVLLELLSLLSKPEVDSAHVVNLITFDPALTAKVLQRCNNGTFGRAEPVDDLHEAVRRIGFNQIYRLAAAVIAESTLRGTQKGYGMDLGDLWQHSAVTAIAGQIVARELGGDENLVFTSALLHDIGKLVLSTSLNAYSVVIQGIGQSDRSFVEAEKALLGVEHAEVGGRVLARWNFPENLVQAVWHHHDPMAARKFEQLAACVSLADMIAHTMGYAPGHQAYAVRVCREVRAILEITVANVDNFVIQTDEALKEADWLTPVAS